MLNFLRPLKKEIVFVIFISLLLVHRSFQSILARTEWYQDWSNYPILRIISLAFLFSYILSVVICHFRRGVIIKWACYIIVFILFFVDCFLYFNFNSAISPNILLLISETNIDESRDFFNLYVISKGSILSYLITGSLLFIVIWIERKREYIQSLIDTIPIRIILISKVCIFLFLCFGCYSVLPYINLCQCRTLDESDDWNKKNFASNGMITSILYSSIHLSLMCDVLYKAVDVTRHVEPSKQKYMFGDDSLNVILVIGESDIKCHNSLYGYRLKTNSYLGREKEHGNLFEFNNVISHSFLTSTALRNLFSCNSVSESEEWYNFPFFPMIFKKAGFAVYFWDNQFTSTSSAAYDFSLNAYIHNAELSKLIYKKRHEMVSLLDGDMINSFIKYAERKQLTSKNLIIFHLQGQHNDQKSRYPSTCQFSKFSTNDILRNESWMTEKKKEEIVHYDNCTYYKDYVVESIVDYFRNSNSILIYLSDHGEDIYDTGDRRGRKLHLDKNDIRTIKVLYEIPLVIWCSDKYMKLHNSIVEAIKIGTNKPFMSDNLCHPLMTLGGITSDWYNERRDPLNNKFLYTPRIMDDGRNYDSLVESKMTN